MPNRFMPLAVLACLTAIPFSMAHAQERAAVTDPTGALALHDEDGGPAPRRPARPKAAEGSKSDCSACEGGRAARDRDALRRRVLDRFDADGSGRLEDDELTRIEALRRHRGDDRPGARPGAQRSERRDRLDRQEPGAAPEHGPRSRAGRAPEADRRLQRGGERRGGAPEACPDCARGPEAGRTRARDASPGGETNRADRIRNLLRHADRDGSGDLSPEERAWLRRVGELRRRSLERGGARSREDRRRQGRGERRRRPRD